MALALFDRHPPQRTRFRRFVRRIGDSRIMLPAGVKSQFLSVQPYQVSHGTSRRSNTVVHACV